MIRGRKVTDPVVQGATGTSYDNKPGLSKAWDTVSRAKSELRKAEQRLEEAERLTAPPQLNQTGETSITDYGVLSGNREYNETYSLPEPSGVVVDNYGRSAYLKSKTQTSRKISRLDDKYVEESDEKESRKKSSSSSKSRENHVNHSSKKKQPTIHLQEKKYDREPQKIGANRGLTDRRVEFSDHVRYLENHLELDNGYSDSRYHDNIPSDQSTLTTSRDIRETEINFLNNNLTRDHDSHRGYETGSRLTHVSVTVPGSSRPLTAGSGYSGAGSQRAGSNKKSHFLDLVSESPQMDGKISDCSQSDSESGRGRKFKGNIKLGPDGLAKIKETIRKQQSKSSSQHRENNEDALGASGGDIPELSPPSQLEPPPTHRLLHDANEPIPRSQEMIEGAEKTAKVRKIAAGPAAPTYKGFSETEVKFRIVESKGPKSQDSGKKDKKRQVSIRVQDRRTEPLGTWLSVEEGDGKTKKVTRVIAPSRKSTKQQAQPPKNKEIITTSSWRAGQELILRELGPVKKKQSKTRDYPEANRNETASPTEERPETQGGDDYFRTGVGSATAAEIQHHKALSEEARRVYSDLHLEDEGHHKSNDKDKRWKAPVKRKAPKTSETEKQQQPSAKQRHYDQEQVRKYMQRQKADRVRQQKEEDNRLKEEAEARRRQLEELYNKQKQASATSAAVGKKEKLKQRQSVEGAGVDDLQRHLLYNTDRARYMTSVGGENKENQDDDMEISDSDSTITGNDSEDQSPNGSPRRSKMDVDAPTNTRQTFNKDVLKVNKTNTNTNTQPRVEPESSNVRTYGDFTFDMGSVTNKFSQALQAKLNEEPPSLVGKYGSLNNNGDHYNDQNRHSDGTRSRADRIQAIKDTAATLQNRLKEEARKIQAQSSTTNNIENGASSRPTVRWNDTEASRRDREEEFMSRYERVTAAKDDFSVFKSNLPGSQPVVRQPEVGVAAPGKPKLPSGTTNNDIGEDTTITETSTFSEITLTDDSDDDDDLTSRKIGTGLRKSDFHAGQTGTSKPSTQLNIPRPTHPSSIKASNSWDDSQIDEYNVFSIYSRRLVRPGREPMSKKKASELEAQPVNAQPTAAPRSSSAPQRSAPLSARSKSPGSRRSEGAYSQNTESLRTQSPIERTVSHQSRSGARTGGDYHDEEPELENTLGEDSYTQSFESEEKTASRGKSISEKHVQSHRSLPASMKTTSKVLDRSSPEVESSMEEEISQEEPTPRSGRMPDSEPSGPPRLSPNSLERKFYNELHNLESMEMSLKQLTSVDRTRAVSMAQQETVSLAQMLKARQQGYELQFKDIQLKAQLEATEATKQLEDARKRASEAAINAADMIAKVRGEGVSAMQESTRKLIDTQTQAAKATAEAAKFLSEARALGLQDTNTLAVETAAAAAAAAVNTALEKKWQGGRQRSMSGTTKRRSDEAQDNDDSESIGSVDDFSINESMTEDEREEKSFRLILPSESHRKKGKHVHSDNESVTSEASSTRLLDHDLHTLFKEHSFDKFTEDMVKQFMKEEALQAQHQQSLLKLRENALLEKTKAELQWLEQQKQRIRNKGADDSYPQIKKRQRGLKLKLQEQQEEIRRLREESKAAAKERQRKLYEEITKRQAAQNQPVLNATPRGRLGRPNEVHTEAEVSSIDEASDVEKRRKNYKSDSEIYTEPKSSARRSKQDPEKYKKIHLDEKFLTQRQSQLMDRRRNAEELLKWKSMLDKEEQRVYKLEKKALKVWDHKEAKKEEPSLTATKQDFTDKLSSKKENGTTKDSTIKTVSMTQDRDSTLISENISTARDESLYTSIKEDIKTASLESSPEELHKRMMNDKSNIKNHNRSGSESSSVMEDIPSGSSVDESKKMNDSSDDTMTHSYGNETFDDTVTATTSKKTSKSITTSKSPLEKLKKYKSLSSPGRSPRGLFSSRSQSRNSESESEDSISLNESQSELSDFEGRIRALNEELRKRKTEADKLKRERKKKKRELMKNKEETLKKQIEAYDNQIAQLKVDLQKEMTHEPAKSSVRPQIKQPKVSPSKIKTPAKRADTDSSGPDSSQVSPNIPEDKDQKQISPPTPVKGSKSAQLDKISEGSETPTSRSERSEPTYKERVQSIKDLVKSEFSSTGEDKTEEIEEDIVSATSESSGDKTKEIKIDLKKNEDMYDVSESVDDINTSAAENVTNRLKLPLSAVSQNTEDIDSKHVPDSARSVTELISEEIVENIPSVSASESFIKQLDLKAQGKDNSEMYSSKFEKDIESDGDISQRSSVVESSRPSSGRSERSSVMSYQTEHESSESEKSPALVEEEKVPNVGQEKNELTSKKKPSGLISNNVFDIDDLLGNYDNEEMTPVASPRGTPRDTSRADSVSEKTHSNFFDPLGDFEIGDTVSVTGPSGDRVFGTLLFKGNVQFAPGVWAGVELERPEGRHNGMEDGIRYFTCRSKHGLIVPGHDMLPANQEPEIEKDAFDNVNVRTSVESIESVSSVNSENNDLINLISEADRNVQLFNESPLPSPREPAPRKQSDAKTRNEVLADKITNDLFESVVRENVSTMNRIADRKQAKQKKGPPVAPKPAKKSEVEEPQLNGDIDDLEHFLQPSDQEPEPLTPREDEQPVRNQQQQQRRETEKHIDDRTDVAVSNMMNDAIEHMLEIRRNNRHAQDVNQSRDSGIVEEEQIEAPSSPTDEIQGVLDKADDDDDVPVDAPLRPGSPVPGLKSEKDSHKPVIDSGLFDGDYEEELWVPPNKSPPPYPGADSEPRSGIPRSELKKFAEEVFYAVPHEEKEIDSIVSSAVDEYWEQRRYGEPLSDLQPSEAFYTHEEIGSDLISNSRRVFKKLLFDLTGEIIRNIYKEEEYDSPVAWHKPKRKTNKFYKGSSPPTTVDMLKPVVQETVIDILGLNGAKKSSEKTKWAVRKKKDLVDTILVQELREEEPEWVNYDDDELAVKMQLTETIFNDLLTDTVQTMNKIFRKKQSLQQQKEAAN